MHELPITRGILELVLSHAKEAGGGPVTDIHLVLGELSSFVNESIEFYWQIISAGTLAENARLHFRRIPLLFDCRGCGALFAPMGSTFECVHCGSAEVSVAHGDELRVEAIDIDKPELSGIEPRSL